ncbi:hypothetical protein CAEBREN_15163 [Caenorhabditis brenneri]|uniref:SPK domain-containing protein n=1 Tax=Caenorhabditis brenneri TaxID=135651 RepID=G0NRX6_CAEBE|nr:hypothetical protein CAEBREN_15163 [Caenorhabditis brenneri]
MNPLRIPQSSVEFCIQFEFFKRNPAPVARTNVLQLFDSSLMKQSNLFFPQMEPSFMNNPLSSEPSPRSSKRKYTSDTDTPTSTDSAPSSKNRKTTSEDQYMEIEQDSNVHESTEFESKTGDANDSRNNRDESLELCLELEMSPNQLELQIQREIRELEEKFQEQKKEYLRKKKTLQFKLLELRNNKINGNMPRQTVEATIVDVPKDSETFSSKRFQPIGEEMLLHFIYDELQKEKPVQIGAESFWLRFVNLIHSKKSPNGWRCHYKNVMRKRLWTYDYPKSKMLVLYRNLGIRIIECEKEDGVTDMKAQIEKDYKVQLALDDYGFLISWTFENQEDVETDEMMMKDAPKIQLFYLSKNDKKKNESIWRAIKERRIKRWIVFDYNYVPEPDDFMFLEADTIYGVTDQSMTREPNDL